MQRPKRKKKRERERERERGKRKKEKKNTWISSVGGRNSGRECAKALLVSDVVGYHVLVDKQGEGCD